MSTVRRCSLLLLLGALTLGLTACANTIRGVGQDIEETGDAIADAAG